MTRPRPCAAADERVWGNGPCGRSRRRRKNARASPIVRLVWQSVRCSRREHRPERRDSHGCSFERDCLQEQSSVHDTGILAGRPGDEGRMTCPPGHSTLITGTPRPLGIEPAFIRRSEGPRAFTRNLAAVFTCQKRLARCFRSFQPSFSPRQTVPAIRREWQPPCQTADHDSDAKNRASSRHSKFDCD